MRFIHGRMIGLDASERDRFFAYAYLTTRNSRRPLSYGLPLLFLAGWLRDYVVMTGPDANVMLAKRGLLVAALFLFAWLSHLRSIGAWRELAGVAYVCAYSTGIVMTTLAEPARLSLAHVAAMLMTIILLPHAFRPLTTVGVILALALPLFLMMLLLASPPMLWLAYLLYSLVGIGIGLAQRRAYLDSALDLFQLRKRLLARLHVDSLTGALNREGWQVHAQRHVTRSQHDGSPLSLVYFDLDHFKTINDQQGHAVGDRILQAAAATMLAQCRPGELLARLGGEEFVTLLPGTDEAGAYHYAERIRLAIAGLDGPAALTLSAGVAEHSHHASLDLTIVRADTAMLEAKRRGRNLVLRASHLGACGGQEPAPSK